MKSVTTNLMAAAAALIVVAGSASAQVLKAEIPFTFTAADVRMAPGTYRVMVQRSSGGIPLITLYNAERKASAMTLANPGKDAPREWLAARQAILSFACAEGHCDLRTVWVGEGAATLSLPAPRHGMSELAGVEVINIRAVKAD